MAHAGAARLLSGDASNAATGFQALAARTDERRYPALAGRVQGFRTTALLRLDRPQDAIATAHAAASLLERAGEPELESGVLGIAADASFATGDPATGYAAAHRAIQRLRAYPGTPPLHNALFALAETAAADGFGHFALHVQTEDVAVAQESGDPLYQAEATLGRARIHARAGQPALARTDLAAGRGLVSRIEIRDAQAWMAADLKATEGAVNVVTHPAKAAAALDSAIGFFAARHMPLKVLPALVTRAEARLSLNDIPGATADLDRAIGILDDRRSAMGNHLLRAAVMDAAKSIIDRAVLLHLSDGRTAEALSLLDRGRASLATSRTHSRQQPPQLPPGEVALSYTVVADTLLIWTVVGREISVARRPVDTAELARIIERVRTALETNVGKSTLSAGLEELHRLLIGPVAPNLGSAGETLVIIADGDLATVPFAALRDPSSERYLVQDHPLRFATSLTEAARKGLGASGSNAAVVIADPAFDEARNPILERLGGAKAEANVVSRLHPQTVVVEGKAATPTAFLAAMRGASLVHYAGHAVFDDDLPHRSYLVLAPEPRHPGRLTAEDVSGSDLQNVRLVVLSACSTVRSGSGRSGGFVGLAGSFLAAGAGGVLGSLWRVDDGSTLALMSAFHRTYSGTENAAASLRSAQLAMLGSLDPALRSPTTWAGFRYTGP
jgi:CHAT domain-containing protein